MDTGNQDGNRQSNTLQSWKEIARYLGRGVRTAQRWEQKAGLPVRRPQPGDRSPVFAFPDEIDAWLRSRPRGVAAYPDIVRGILKADKHSREWIEEATEQVLQDNKKKPPVRSDEPTS